MQNDSHIQPSYRQWAVCGMLFLAAMLPTLADAQLPETLAAPSITKTIAGNVNWGKRQLISNGYIVSFGQAAQNSVDITLTSLSTRNVDEITLKIGGLIAVTGAAVVSADMLVATGIYKPATTGLPTPFLAYTDFTGAVKSISDLGMFAPQKVCTTADGNAWVLGQDLEKEAQFYSAGNDITKVGADSDYDMLRKYAPGGQLIRTQLRRSTIRLSSKYYSLVTASESSALTCGETSTGVYLSSAFFGVSPAIWFEVQHSDSSTRTFFVHGQPPMARLTGLSLPYQGTLYASFDSFTNGARVSSLYTLATTAGEEAYWILNTTRSAAASGPTSVPELKVLGEVEKSVAYVSGASTEDPSSAIVALSAVTRSKEIPPSLATQLKEETQSSDGVVDAAITAASSQPASAFWFRVLGVAKRVADFSDKYKVYCPAANTACATALSDLKQRVTDWWKLYHLFHTTNLSIYAIYRSDVIADLQAINKALPPTTYKPKPTSVPIVTKPASLFADTTYGDVLVSDTITAPQTAPEACVVICSDVVGTAFWGTCLILHASVALEVAALACDVGAGILTVGCFLATPTICCDSCKSMNFRRRESPRSLARAQCHIGSGSTS